jgi:aryl-alcohol dehydrogenase-like predicted oxidoreductase
LVRTVKSDEAQSAEIVMEFAEIPGTALEVSRIALGTWAIGGWMWGGNKEAESIATIRAALAHGINVIDTAPVYGFGHSEEIVGKALTDGLRQHVILATKVGLEWHDGKITRNGSRERIMREIGDSLRRLRTDTIDVYQVHWPDPKVPMEETAKAMLELYEQGTIRAIGASNFSVAQMEAFRRVAPLHVLQSPYNLFERANESEILHYCRKHGIATFGYGVLCRGLLSGRMRADRKFTGDDLRLKDPKFQPPRASRNICGRGATRSIRTGAIRKARYRLGRALGARPGHHHGAVGARRPKQLDPVEEAMGWSLDTAAKVEIDRTLQETITDPVGPEFMAPPEES